MTILAGWLGGPVEPDTDRCACTSNASEEQCCRIITSSDDACMHPRPTIILLPFCRLAEKSEGSVGRQGLASKEKEGEVR